MISWGEPTGSYGHSYTPLCIHQSLDATAGLRGIWAGACGSPLRYSDKWEPMSPTLYTSGNFTLGLDTSSSRSGAGKIIHMFFGKEGSEKTAMTIGDDRPWTQSPHPPGCGAAYATRGLPEWERFGWAGAELGEPWSRPLRFEAWGDPNLTGLPRPQRFGVDPLEAWLPPTLAAPLEEGGAFGWAAPLGMPAAALPRRSS